MGNSAERMSPYTRMREASHQTIATLLAVRTGVKGIIRSIYLLDMLCLVPGIITNLPSVLNTQLFTVPSARPFDFDAETLERS